MKKFFRHIFIIISTLILTSTCIYAWTGLIAENGDYITIEKWNELVNSVSGWATPYITTIAGVNIAPSTTTDITIAGDNFEPDSTFTIPGFDGTINTVTHNSPYELIANITTGTTQTTYDLVVSNGGKASSSWTGNGSNLLTIVPPVYGTWPAGTYTEWFEAGLWNWINSIGNGRDFDVNSNGTPSNGTGPNGASVGTFYIFSEASTNVTPVGSPNVVFAVETTNFRKAQSISFDYHMFGTNMGTLIIQTRNGWVWTTRNTITGQQQAAQGDPWLNAVVDLSSFQVDAIKIQYTSWGGFSSDAAIDNVIINSVN